jgi:hypothetical protein
VRTTLDRIYYEDLFGFISIYYNQIKRGVLLNDLHEIEAIRGLFLDGCKYNKDFNAFISRIAQSKDAVTLTTSLAALCENQTNS